MLDQDVEESFTPVRHRRATDQTGKLDSLLLADFVHDCNRGTVPKEDAFGIHSDGITQVVLPDRSEPNGAKQSEFTTVEPGLKTSGSLEPLRAGVRQDPRGDRLDAFPWIG